MSDVSNQVPMSVELLIMDIGTFPRKKQSKGSAGLLRESMDRGDKADDEMVVLATLIPKLYLLYLLYLTPATKPLFL